MLLGEALLKAGDAATAEAVLRIAQRRHPDDVWLSLLLGQALEKLARRPEAICYYMIVRSLRPGLAHPLAHALDLQGETHEAIAVFQELVRLGPPNALHLFCFGKILRSQGRDREANDAFDSAIAAGREALKLRADDPMLHAIIGNVLRERGRLDEAIGEYDQALRLAPNDALAHSNLAQAQYHQGHLNDAIAELREAIRLDPSDHRTHINLARALNARGRTDEAIAELREAIRLQPDHATAHFSLGVVLFGQNRVDDALGEFREVTRLQPGSAAAHSELGAILCDFKHDHDAAITEFRAAIRLAPDDPVPHFGMGNALSHRGQTEEALAEYRKVLRLKPGDAEVHESVGLMLARLARCEQAIAEYRTAIRLKPDVASAHYKLAAILHLVGRNDEAMSEYRVTCQLAPGLAEAHCSLAGLLRLQGLYAESLAEYEHGHKLGSGHTDWSFPSRPCIDQVRQLIALEAKFPALLRGEIVPADAVEGLYLAEIAHTQGRHAMAARLVDEALGVKPRLVDDVDGRHRYDAACFAALAGCGKGNDQPSPDEAARRALRRQAFDWLKADLVIWSRMLATAGSEQKSSARHLLEHARFDPHLVGVRELSAIRQLPGPERADWRFVGRGRRRPGSVAKPFTRGEDRSISASFEIRRPSMFL